MENYHLNTEYVSNSMLGWLKVSPRYFIEKVNKVHKQQEVSSSMELGTMIHLALLEPDKFTVSKVDKPTGKMGIYCDALVEGKTFEEAYEVAGFKHTHETVLENYNKVGYKYVKSSLENKNKIFLERKQKYIIDRSVDAILKSKQGSMFILEEEALNELELYWERDGIKKKGKVDKLILKELQNNVVLNVDVKTTSSNIYNLDEEDKSSYLYSFKKYGYHRQLAMYDEGIKDYIKKEYDKDVQVIHLHVVVNTTSFESIVYKFSDSWIELGKEELNKLLDEYKWHKETDYWNTPKDFIDGIIKV